MWHLDRHQAAGGDSGGPPDCGPAESAAAGPAERPVRPAVRANHCLCGGCAGRGHPESLLPDPLRLPGPPQEKFQATVHPAHDRPVLPDLNAAGLPHPGRGSPLRDGALPAAVGHSYHPINPEADLAGAHDALPVVRADECCDHGLQPRPYLRGHLEHRSQRRDSPALSGHCAAGCRDCSVQRFLFWGAAGAPAPAGTEQQLHFEGEPAGRPAAHICALEAVEGPRGSVTPMDMGPPGVPQHCDSRHGWLHLVLDLPVAAHHGLQRDHVQCHQGHPKERQGHLYDRHPGLDPDLHLHVPELLLLL
mmetsp:Transcript_18776/g.33203  ORF Transcript_18776/g.33203 Transcript_18776/m.33203 type:complete len:305 (-) Transcript_18776:1719-2633(-)